MPWYFTVFTILSALVLLLHSLALVLLFKIKVVNGSQKYLLTSLCLVELCLGANSILFSTFKSLEMVTVLETVEIFDLIPLYLLYLLIPLYLLYLLIPLYLLHLLIMIFITLDRLFEFRLNIKYSLYWSPKKTFYALTIVFSILILVLVCLIILKVFFTSFDFVKIIMIYVLPQFGIIFMILAIYTYYLIFKKLKRNRRTSRKIKQNIMMQNSRIQNETSTKGFRVFVPSLIIATFILLSIIPYVTMLIYYYVFNEQHQLLLKFILIMFPLGWLADAVIYIFTLRQIRRKIAGDICRLWAWMMKRENKIPTKTGTL